MKRTGLKVTAGVLATVVGGALSLIKVNEVSNEKEATQLVNNVWNEHKNELVKRLGLHKTPALKFEPSDDAVMYVKHMMTLTSKSNRFSLDRIVKSTTPEYVIYVDPAKVKTLVNFYLSGTFYLSPSVKEAIVKQLLAHECRHIWQSQGDYHIGEVIPAFHFDFLNGHGVKKEEVDANEFALSYASNEKEECLFALQKVSQEHSGKLCISNVESKEMVEARNKFIKAWNPVIRLFR